MSDEIRDLKESVERGFAGVEVRCTTLSSEIRGVSDKVIALDTRWGEHMHVHRRIDGRIDGLEGREREATQTGIKHPAKDSDPPRKNGRVNGEKLKTWIQIGFGIGVGLLLVYNLYASPSKEEVELIQQRNNSIAAATEGALKEHSEATQEVKRSRAELQAILEALKPLMMETEMTP